MLVPTPTPPLFILVVCKFIHVWFSFFLIHTHHVPWPYTLNCLIHLNINYIYSATPKNTMDVTLQVTHFTQTYISLYAKSEAASV